MIAWSARTYVDKLAELLTAEVEGIRVEGLRPQRHPDALQEAVLVEVEIERFETSSAGTPNMLDANLMGALVVTRKATTTEAETELLDLTLEVATVLQDLHDQGALGPAQVYAVEPEPLEAALERCVAAWRISFSQQLRIQRATGSEPPVPYDTLFSASNGRDPEQRVP